MNILVTGGAGFIGSNISKRLLQLGHNVTIIDSLITGKKENLDEIINDVEFIEDSICNNKIMEKICENKDAIFHEAAIPSVPRSIEKPFESNEANITGTLSVLHNATKRGVNKVIYAASSSAYGERGEDYKNENMLPSPLSPYAVNKLCGEYYLKAYSAMYPIETISLRYFNVFGPNQDPNSMYSAVIPLFIRQFYNNESPIINGDGTQSRDFTYISNVVDANILALNSNGIKGEVINAACSVRTTVLEVAKKIQKIMGKENIPIKFGPVRKGDIKHSLASIDKAKELLKFSPKVNLEEGLELTIDHLLKKWSKK